MAMSMPAYTNFHPAMIAAWNQMEDLQEGPGSGASTPAFMTTIPGDAAGDCGYDEKTATPVLRGASSSLEVRVAKLQDKLQELQLSRAAAAAPSKLCSPPGLAPPPGLSLLPRATSNLLQVSSSPQPKKWQVSVGTVGHPFTCSTACPHLARTGECPDGAQCNHCHECAVMPTYMEPQNVTPNVRQEQQPAPAVQSVGTLGHPHTCAGACKYVKRKSGCRNGAQCLDCHLCHWQRTPLPKPPAEFDPSFWLDRELNHGLQVPQKPAVRDILPQTIAPPQRPQFLQCEPCKVEIGSTGGRPSSVIGRPDFLNGLTDDGVTDTQACASVGSIGHPYSCGIACKYARKQKGCKDGNLCVCCHLCIWRRCQQ